MKVLLLSRKSTNYSSRRLIESWLRSDAQIVPVDPLDCVACVGDGTPAVHWNGAPLSADLVIPRFGPGLMEFALPVLRQLEHSGIPSLNDSSSIERSRDKFHSLQILAREGLPVPRTVMARSASQLDHALDLVGPGPVVVKVLKGSQGTGVVRLDGIDPARRFLERVYEQKHNPMAQRYLVEAAGRDERILVVGGRAIAGMMRQARDGEFRANVHQGSRVVGIPVDGPPGKLAVRAAAALGLEVAGVDIVRTDRGPVILEINPSPGLEGIETATGVDVAGEIVRWCIDRHLPMR
jgi:ribosomal protein S6--L-glutamate ligase